MTQANGSGTARAEAPAIPARDLSGLIPAKNGALRDPKTGKIVTTPGGGKHAITAETSAMYRKIQEQERINAVYKGLLTGTDQRDIESAITTVIAAQTTLALNTMAGRASTEASRFVWTAAELMPDRKPEISEPMQALGIGFARELCRILQDNTGFIAENDIIDAEIVGNGKDGGDDDVIVAEFRQELDDNG